MRPQLWCDFETGGTNPWFHSPLSCALLAVRNGKIVGEWYTQIREAPFNVTEEAMQINKLNLKDEGLSFEKFRVEYFRRVNYWFYGGTDWARSSKTFIPGKTKASKQNMPFFCGHNTYFDKQVLQRILGGTHNKDVFDGVYYHRIDTMVLANTLQDCGIITTGENLKLETLCKILDVEPEENGDFHNALTDLRMTFKAYLKMKSILTDKQLRMIYDDSQNSLDDGQSVAAFLGETASVE